MQLEINGRPAIAQPKRILINDHKDEVTNRLYFLHKDGREVYSGSYPTAERAVASAQRCLREVASVVSFRVEIKPMEPDYLDTYEITFLDEA